MALKIENWITLASLQMLPSSHMCPVAILLNNTDIEWFQHGREFQWTTLDFFHWGNYIMDSITAFTCLIIAFQNHIRHFCPLQLPITTSTIEGWGKTPIWLASVHTPMLWVSEWGVVFYPKLRFGNHPLMGHAPTFQITMTHCLKISSSTAQGNIENLHSPKH